jgi:hypothetical protein
MADVRISAMACPFHLPPPASPRAHKGQEHARTIPLAEVRLDRLLSGAAIESRVVFCRGNCTIWPKNASNGVSPPY